MVFGFSKTNLPSSSRTINVSPVSNSRERRNEAGITSLPWQPKCTSTDFDDSLD